MSLVHVFERKYRANGDFELARLDQMEEFGSVVFEILSLDEVAVDDWAHQLDVLEAEAQNVKRRNDTRLEQVSIFTN